MSRLLRRLALPGLVTLCAFATLLYLGSWQAQRLTWKTALLAEIAALEQGPAVPLTDTPRLFTKVALHGRFDHAREALLELEVRGPVLGARLVTPLLRAAGPPVLVDRGWVPVSPTTPVARPEGEVEVLGYVRLSEARSRFAAVDDVAQRRFFTFEVPAIAAALGLAEVTPFGVVAIGPYGGLPDPARHLPRPTNNHLGYAITWFGLAFALAGVFLVWARRRMKETA
jgi:surfeit locus 1 family protein